MFFTVLLAETVASPAFRHDVSRSVWISFELSSQSCNMYVDSSRLARKVAPHLGQQLRAWDNQRTSEHQVLQEPKFFSGKGDRLAGFQYSAMKEIDIDIA